jgi:hypothetical protein
MAALLKPVGPDVVTVYPNVAELIPQCQRISVAVDGDLRFVRIPDMRGNQTAQPAGHPLDGMVRRHVPREEEGQTPLYGQSAALTEVPAHLPLSAAPSVQGMLM